MFNAIENGSRNKIAEVEDWFNFLNVAEGESTTASRICRKSACPNSHITADVHERELHAWITELMADVINKGRNRIPNRLIDMLVEGTTGLRRLCGQSTSPNNL